MQQGEEAGSSRISWNSANAFLTKRLVFRKYSSGNLEIIPPAPIVMKLVDGEE
jgi:hypothetical protein